MHLFSDNCLFLTQRQKSLLIYYVLLFSLQKMMHTNFLLSNIPKTHCHSVKFNGMHFCILKLCRAPLCLNNLQLDCYEILKQLEYFFPMINSVMWCISENEKLSKGGVGELKIKTKFKKRKRKKISMSQHVPC